MKQTSVAGSGLVVGLLVGAVLGLLFAPKKGSETRGDIAKASRKTAESTSKYFKRAERKAGKVRRDIYSHVEVLVERVKQGDEDAKQELNNLLDNLDEAANRS